MSLGELSGLIFFSLDLIRPENTFACKYEVIQLYHHLALRILVMRSFVYEVEFVLNVYFDRIC